MQERYLPHDIEKKWRNRWRERRTFEVAPDPHRPKFYVLEMLPYPSGRIHIGHVRNYSIGDAYAWYKRLRGFNVLHPMGWDAFGMPAENAAIKNGARPDEWTLANIAAMRAQLQRMGFSYDWSREIASCTPEYYRWNQWLFIQLHKKGLLYRKKAMVNWCPKCQTSLANEQSVNGFCWRHPDTPVEQRELEQWFVKLTHYNEELLAGIDGPLRTGWPEKVLTMQRNWIGRSDGAFLDFALVEAPDVRVRVFTTRIDTAYGANACIVAPEHPLLPTLLPKSPHRAAVEAFIARVAAMSRQERTEAREKEGVDTGLRVVNPFSQEIMPLWVANFVLADYGAGAVMSVPAHDERDFEFSRTYKLPIRRVIWNDIKADAGDTLRYGDLPFTEPGALGPVCGPFSGLDSEVARRRMTEHAVANGFGEAAVTYRIRDWGVSRQRAWGTPIPMIHCPECGAISPEKEENLPVRLPADLDFSVGAPLAAHAAYHANVVCPVCGAAARRDTDTMDTFVDSNWYYFRYCDPHNDHAPFDRAAVEHWMPVDFYVGGVEHAVLHLIYTRVWSMMLRDLGLVSFGEPVERLLTQGMVILNGAKMSKSLGNVVDPDEMIDRYGSDATRLSILFASPPDREVDWKQVVDETGCADYPAAEGGLRYLTRVWRIARKWRDACEGRASMTETPTDAQRALRRATHRTIRRVTDAFEDGLRINVAVAGCMELTNALYDFDAAAPEAPSAGDRFVVGEALETLTRLLAPLAPHFAEELWEACGHAESLAHAAWPVSDPDLARDALIEVPVQINGKLRAKILVPPDIADDDLKRAGLDDPKIHAAVAGKEIVKCVVVPRRLVNIVVK
jgi:leucyl-tRNA synthetase